VKDKDAFEDRLFGLIGYMITSGRNLLDETPLYGPFRLVDAASRLIGLLEDEGMASDRLLSIRQQIDAGKHSVMSDADEFRGYLDRLVYGLVDRMGQ